MASISINPHIKVDLDAILAGIEELDTPALEAFAEKVADLVAKRKVDALSKEETTLILKINEGIPKPVTEKYEQLRAKQQRSKLSSLEKEELDQVIDEIEIKEAERLEYMMALAKIWDISIEELRERLEIKSPEPNVR